MSNFEWHYRLSVRMISIAEELEPTKYPHLISYIALRAFEELIDAYSAKDGLHFHDEFLVDAWKSRVEWMRLLRADLLHDWNLMSELYSLISIGKGDLYKLLKMLQIVKYYLDKIIQANYEIRV